MEQLNNQFELEKIKKKLLMTYTRYNGTNIPYTDEEMLKAAILIKRFFDKLDNMLIYEDNLKNKTKFILRKIPKKGRLPLTPS